jgi:N-acetylglucosamine-6-phosphate deacetylase
MVVRGIDPQSGQAREVRFGPVIDGVDDLIRPPEDITDFVTPGFIDIQVNGFAGVDYNVPDTPPDAIGRSLQAQFATGVTRLFPTLITGSQQRLVDCLRNLARAKAELEDGEAMEGFHVEGPHISPTDGPRGAHPVEHVRPPNTAEFDELMEASGEQVRLVTVAPEWPETPRFIEHVVRRGVAVSLGHTGASAEQIQVAVEAGATLITHMGNGMPFLVPRHPNLYWHMLAEDRLNALFICDGIHLDNAFLKVALRAKGIERSILTTDAVMPAGCEPGAYTIGGVAVLLHANGSVTLAENDRLAGSALPMDRAMEHLIRRIGLTVGQVVTMATRNPARAARVRARQRGLLPGERADLVRFSMRDGELVIRETYLSGRKVFG